MSDVLTGSASNVTTPLVARIIALANNGSGAIRATTVAPHLFGSGDSVAVAVTSSGTPVVVGTFTIAVIDSTHFDLVGSTYTATGVGNASDLSLTPQIQVPTDGDTFSAQLSGLLSAFQGLMDRTQYVNLHGSARLVADAGNWRPPYSVGTITGDSTSNSSSIFASAWDPLNLRWLIGGAYSTHGFVNVWSTYDGSDGTPIQATSGFYNFFGVTGSAATGMAICQDPTRLTNVWTATIDATDLLVEYNDGSAWHNPATGSLSGVSSLTDVQMLTFGGYII